MRIQSKSTPKKLKNQIAKKPSMGPRGHDAITNKPKSKLIAADEYNQLLPLSDETPYAINIFEVPETIKKIPNIRSIKPDDFSGSEHYNRTCDNVEEG